VVDIDGTLTDGKQHICTAGIEALRRVMDNGTVVSIASGNVLPIAYGASVYIGLNGPIIAENGGVVCHRNEVIELFDPTVPERALQELRRHMEVRELFTSRWRRTEVALERSTDLAEGDVVIERTGFALHLMNAGHGKGAGVRKAAEILGIGTEQIAAFGDSDNDVSMFRQCGASVAVGNASPAAKLAAGYVSPKNHAEGVIDGLNKLGLL